MSYGFVYALSNRFMPGVYKIGFTTNHPRVRVDELSRATACPAPFDLLAYFGCADPQTVEREIHLKFDQYRVNQSREFFCVDIVVLRDEFREWVDMDAFYSDLLDQRCHEQKLQQDPELAAKVRAYAAAFYEGFDE